MIAFVRSLTRSATRAGSMFRSSSRTSANTGVAPVWTITFAVAGHVIGDVITSSPAPDVERDEREVHRRRARRDREHVLGLEHLRGAALELGRLRPGRQPAGAERLRDGGDLLLADRRRLEAQARRSYATTRAASTSKRTRLCARSARASASSAESPTARIAPARSEPLRSGPNTWPGLR